MPIHGADAVARFFAGVLRPHILAQFLGVPEGAPLPELDVRITTLNGAPAIVAYAQATPLTAVLLDVQGTQAQTIHLVANPDKLQTLALDRVPLRNTASAWAIDPHPPPPPRSLSQGAGG